MSYSPSIPVAADDSARASRLVVPVAAVTALATLGFNALGTVASGPSADGEHGVGELLFVSALTLVSVALVFGLVVPRALRRESSGGTALTLSLLGLVLVVPAFWSGVIPALAVGGTLLGWARRRGGRGHGLAQAAYVVGLLALVGFVAVYVGDYLHTNGIG